MAENLQVVFHATGSLFFVSVVVAFIVSAYQDRKRGR